MFYSTTKKLPLLLILKKWLNNTSRGCWGHNHPHTKQITLPHILVRFHSITVFKIVLLQTYCKDLQGKCF